MAFSIRLLIKNGLQASRDFFHGKNPTPDSCGFSIDTIPDSCGTKLIQYLKFADTLVMQCLTVAGTILMQYLTVAGTVLMQYLTFADTLVMQYLTVMGTVLIRHLIVALMVKRELDAAVTPLVIHGIGVDDTSSSVSHTCCVKDHCTGAIVSLASCGPREREKADASGRGQDRS